jgi:hypothetical protein
VDEDLEFKEGFSSLLAILIRGTPPRLFKIRVFFQTNTRLGFGDKLSEKNSLLFPQLHYHFL